MASSGLRGHRRAITAFCLGLLAAGCAPAVPDEDIFKLTWGKLGRGYEAFVNDRNNCVQAASVVTRDAAGREQPMPAVSASRFKSCMRSSGWEAVAGGYSAPLGYNVRIVQ
ncbi:MAG: hypothetical protein A3D94_19575 [Alphaproteobacteria bacterium RIFCSPHIGHO2_12_FULL_66_14]|jgi:hypothetical protein|nr:MAG: hypothetical protein A3D94_19575 [Alphaproteobacteria bacterium RIFCSPHIGHO2_12_FULL_66_14]